MTGKVKMDVWVEECYSYISSMTEIGLALSGEDGQFG